VKRRAALLALLCLWPANRVRAEPLACGQPQAATVLLRGAGTPQAALAQIARHLGAGLARVGVAVCVGAGPEQRQVAAMEVDLSPGGEALHIRMQDAITTKTLARAIDLGEIPPDSRALAVALYIEELLSVSWAEVPLQRRIYLREHPAQPPPAEPPPERAAAQSASAPPRRVRLALGLAAARFAGGVTQLGPEFQVGLRALPWLELWLRAGYRTGPWQSAPHGSVQAQALLGGFALDPFWQATRALTLHFPQGLDVQQVNFHVRARADAQSAPGSRPALVFGHGAGLRVMMHRILSLSLLARLCWTALPAEAAEGALVITGVSGVGGEGSFTLDGHF
jgi:hypothetical protein